MGLSDVRLPIKERGLTSDEITLLALYEKLTHLQKERAVAFIQGQLSSL